MEEREKSTDAKAQSLDTTPPTMLSFRPFEDHFKVFEEHLAATQATFPSLTPRRSNPGQEICNPSLQTSGAGTPYPLSLTPFTPIGTNRGSVSNFNVSKSCPSYALRRPTMPGGRLDPAIMDDTASSNSKGSLSYPLPTARTSYMPQRSSLEETRDASSSSKVQAVGLGLVLGWSITESSSRSPKYDSVSGKPGIEQHSTADRSSPFTPSKKRRSKRSMRLSGGAHASTPKPRMPSTPINPHNYGHSQQLRAESSYLVPARGGPGATKGRLWISGRPPYPSPSQYTPQGQNFIFDIRPSNTGSPPIIPDHMTHMFGNGFTPYGGFSGLRNSRPNTIPTPQPMVRVGNFMMPRAEYQRLFAELRCFRCGQHGHVARFCPDENSPLKHFNSNDSPPFAPHHSQNNSVAMDAYKYSQNDPNSEYPQSNSFDPYAAPTPAASTPNHTEAQHIANPYPLDTNGYSQTYFPSAPSHSQFVRLLPCSELCVTD